jgi:two-component SAPR family response regulator
MRVQTFGNFEAYIDGKPIAFKYSKTKELLAYLVDRKGALCTFGELQAVIFEDDGGHESYMKSLRRDLLETLAAAGCDNVIAQQRGKLGVVTDHLDCDYYDWCDGKRMGLVWRGEYMAQYSWSEYTAGVLERMNKN